MSTRGLIALRDPQEHARRRRPWNRAFSPTALKGYTPIILRRTSQLTDALAKHVGEVDLAQWFSYLSCVFSARWNDADLTTPLHSYDFMSDMASVHSPLPSLIPFWMLKRAMTVSAVVQK